MTRRRARSGGRCRSAPSAAAYIGVRRALPWPGVDCQGRAADQRPRPARPFRLPTAGRDGGPRGRQRRPRPLRPAPHPRASSSSSPSAPSCRPERLAEPIEALEAGAPAGAGPARPLGRPRVLLDALARAGAGPAAGHRRRRPAGPLAARAAGRDRPGGRGGAARRRAARRPPAGGARGAERGGRALVRRARRRRSAPTARSCAGSRSAALIATRSSALRRAPEHTSVGARSGPPAAAPRAGGRRRLRSSPRSTASPAPARACSCTASPAPARPRSTWPRSRRRSPAGADAIVLVPEIGLAPQAVARFRARLGDRVAVLHSALSDGERYDEWRRLRDGEASVCVGPRSAVFAPVADLGLLVIDEEHDPSYKQEGDPCYDARAVARRRARDCGAVLVAGTATPRPGVLARAAPAGAAAPRRRAPDAAGRGRRHARGRPALRAAARDDAGGAGEGPRARREGDRDAQPPRLRALADLPLLRPSLGLPELRRLADRPPRAAAAWSAITAPTRSRCRATCGECGSTTLARAGAGTEQVEALLAERLAPMPVFRLDSDTTAAQGRPRARSSPASARPRAPSWSAPRWSPRATTSPR